MKIAQLKSFTILYSISRYSLPLMVQSLSYTEGVGNECFLERCSGPFQNNKVCLSFRKYFYGLRVISLFSMMLNLISQYLYHPSHMLISTYQVMNKIGHKIYTPQFILTPSSMHSVIPSHFPNYNLNYFTLEDMDLHFFFFL